MSKNKTYRDVAQMTMTEIRAEIRAIALISEDDMRFADAERSQLLKNVLTRMLEARAIEV